MIELDGQVYTVNTPAENALAAVTYINQYCIDNNVTNHKGEIISIDISPGSSLYLIILAFSYLTTLCQNLIYNLGRMINIGTCTDKQLMSIGEIIRMRPKEAVPTTIYAVIYAGNQGDCLIQATLTASIRIGNATIIFSPVSDVMVPMGSSRVIILRATSLGSYFIEANTITAFDTNPPNMANMTTEASLPGRDAESYPQLRRRIQARDIASNAIQKCILALRELSGVTSANIFFNFTTVPVNYGNYLVQPRQAMAFIQGYNENIAKTIFSYLMCDMSPAPISQDYVLANGQSITAYWQPPVFISVYIDLYVESKLTVLTTNALITAIQSLALSIEIGGILTAADVIEVCSRDVPSVVLTGVYMTTSRGVLVQGQRAMLDVNEIFDFNRENIRVVEPIST